MGHAHPHVEKAHRYARDVVAGKIPASKWTRLACERHLRDLQRSKYSGSPFRFDPKLAERPCQFAELLPHVKGDWARGIPGDPESTLIRLEPWQCFILCSIFGWVNRKTGLRRFRKVYIEVPRKNGKSVIAAVIGLYMLVADGEVGAEVYCGATKEKQALEVFKPAHAMVRKTPDLVEAFGVEHPKSQLLVPGTESRFEPVVGNPGDGASPSCAIVDEFHEHRDEKLYSTMLTGMGARRQPLLLVITTAGYNIEGPCYQLNRDVREILEERAEGEETFAIIYTIDEGDDWTSEEALKKANPNFGVSVYAEFLRSEQREAELSARKANAFKTKHLNVWVASRAGWMNMQAWAACGDEKRTLADFKGKPCFIGVDLAHKRDIASLVFVFPELRPASRKGKETHEPHYVVFGKYFLPEAQVRDPANKRYLAWFEAGLIIETDGDATDYETVEEELLAALAFEIQQAAFDPWSAMQFSQRMEKAGIPMVELGMNAKNLSEPMKTLEALVFSKRLHHNGDPVLTWQMSNVEVKEDARGNIYPRKPRADSKIDGAVALITAMNRALLYEPPPPLLINSFTEEDLIL
ncbi:terminase large subunit [Vulgatibacter sp.]|uniref:terminase large subunit n=1 Tax=Vulgatibacter sp. TaxID=1971226 RepID=UPI003562B452